MVRMKTPHDSNATNVRAILACSLNVYIYIQYIYQIDPSLQIISLQPLPTQQCICIQIKSPWVVYISLFLPEFVPLWWYSHAKFIINLNFFAAQIRNSQILNNEGKNC